MPVMRSLIDAGWVAAVVLTLFGAFGGLLLCISLYGQLGEGWSPVEAGLMLTPMVVGMIAGMMVSFALVKAREEQTAG